MKNKRILFLLAFILLVFVVYKIFLLFNYSIHIADIDTSVIIKNTLLINTEKKNEEYLVFDNVKFVNYFKDFETKDVYGDMVATYILKNTTDGNQIFSYLKTQELIKSFDEKKLTYDKKFQNINKNDILVKYKIKNDIDLISFLSTRKITNNTILSSKNKIIEKYFFDYILINEFSNLNDITFIEGSYNGYIINNGNIKIVNILKNNKKYIFNFNGSTFTNDFIKEFLESLIIE